MWQVLEKLAALRPPVFIMGGFAEDVLLGDELDRPHKDLDLLAQPGTLASLMAQLAVLQPGEWEVVMAGAEGQPLMLRVRGQAGRLELEIYLTRPETEGFSLEVPAQGPAGRLRLFLPTDTFAYPAVVVDGLPIQTASPLALALMRASSAQTRHVGDKRARDLAMLSRLRAKFLSTLDEAQLQPRIEPV